MAEPFPVHFVRQNSKINKYSYVATEANWRTVFIMGKKKNNGIFAYPTNFASMLDNGVIWHLWFSLHKQIVMFFRIESLKKSCEWPFAVHNYKNEEGKMKTWWVCKV